MAIIPTSGEFTKVPEGGGSDNRFVVTCTPTKADYSGTMDKTTGQILEAYNSGKEIWFAMGGMVFIPIALVDTTVDGNKITFSANALLTDNKNILVVMRTSPVISTEDTDIEYRTIIYQLTPKGS